MREAGGDDRACLAEVVRALDGPLLERARAQPVDLDGFVDGLRSGPTGKAGPQKAAPRRRTGGGD